MLLHFYLVRKICNSSNELSHCMEKSYNICTLSFPTPIAPREATKCSALLSPLKKISCSDEKNGFILIGVVSDGTVGCVGMEYCHVRQIDCFHYELALFIMFKNKLVSLTAFWQCVQRKQNRHN